MRLIEAIGLTFVGLFAFVVNLAFWGGLIFLAFYIADHFGVIGG